MKRIHLKQGKQISRRPLSRPIRTTRTIKRAVRSEVRLSRFGS